MNDLHKAYNILGLEPGTPLESVLRRYKRLIMVWHPDRFPNDEGKRDAEEELKKINNAKDKLKDHFEKGGHSSSGPCACKATGGQSSAGQSQHAGGASSGGPGPGAKRKTTEEQQREEEAARKRSEDRRRAEEAERAKKAAEESARAATATHEKTVQEAMKAESERETESLRWQSAIGCGVLFLILLIVPVIADAVQKPVLDAQNASLGSQEDSDERKKLSGQWSDYINDRQRIASQVLNRQVTMMDAAGWRPPYESNDPGADPISREMYQQFTVQQQQVQKTHDQDVYFAKLDVDKYQKAIEHSQTTIADLEAQIANPAISDYERNKLIDYQNFQRKCLADSQEGLKVAQQKLDQLQGNVATSPPLPDVAVPPSQGGGQDSTPGVNQTLQSILQGGSSSSHFGTPMDPDSVKPAPKQDISALVRSLLITKDGNQGRSDSFLRDSSSAMTTTWFMNSGDYSLESGTRLLNASDLNNLSEDRLLFLYNEPYARHGRRFVSPAIQNYFTNRIWYQPNPGYTTDGEAVNSNDTPKQWANHQLVGQYLDQHFPGWRTQ